MAKRKPSATAQTARSSGASPQALFPGLESVLGKFAVEQGPTAAKKLIEAWNGGASQFIRLTDSTYKGEYYIVRLTIHNLVPHAQYVEGASIVEPLGIPVEVATPDDTIQYGATRGEQWCDPSEYFPKRIGPGEAGNLQVLVRFKDVLTKRSKPTIGNRRSVRLGFVLQRLDRRAPEPVYTDVALRSRPPDLVRALTAGWS